MRRVWAVCRRELVGYLSSPVAYIISAVFLLISGYFYYLIARMTREPSLRYLFNNMAITWLLVAPMVTMRLFAEERKLGTFELLMTSPIRLYELVLGKFLGAALLFVGILGITLQYPLFLIAFGNPDYGPLWTGYLGFTLMGLGFIAVGTFASALTDNQIVASVIAFGILLGFWIIGWASDLVGGPLGSFLQGLALTERLENFVKGVLDSGDVIYYLSVIVVFLFLTVRALDWRRW